MCFKVYGYISMTQALTFVSDFKLGHYMKIPPRTMFMAQVNFLQHWLIKMSNIVTKCVKLLIANNLYCRL